MRHFVQYHNAETQGDPSQPSRGRLSIYTRKPVQALIGDRVWLVSGQGRPRSYALVGSFLVSEVNEDSEGTNTAWGQTLTSFAHPIPINGTDWFGSLRRATGNFAFGLQRLTEAAVIEGLLEVCFESAKASSPNGSSPGGAFFGTPEENQLVEQAAIKAATRHYRAKGWQVMSHEDLNLGYDLQCQKSNATLYVEVKGVRGSKCSFILTSNERDFAERNGSFRLCVVTNALNSRHRAIHEFTPADLASKFYIEPLSFAVRLKT